MSKIVVRLLSTIKPFFSKYNKKEIYLVVKIEKWRHIVNLVPPIMKIDITNDNISNDNTWYIKKSNLTGFFLLTNIRTLISTIRIDPVTRIPNCCTSFISLIIIWFSFVPIGERASDGPVRETPLTSTTTMQTYPMTSNVFC